MPLKVEGLTPDSTDEEIQEAISDSIAQCVREGREQAQCVAMVHDMTRTATGKAPLPRGEGRKTTRRITGLEEAIR